MSEPLVVDARGLRCPQPVVLAARATRDLPVGTVVVVLADDPAAHVDVPAWAWLRGHAVEVREVEGWSVYTVRVGESDEEGPGAARVRST